MLHYFFVFRELANFRGRVRIDGRFHSLVAIVKKKMAMELH